MKDNADPLEWVLTSIRMQARPGKSHSAPMQIGWRKLIDYQKPRFELKVGAVVGVKAKRIHARMGHSRGGKVLRRLLI